MVELKEGYRFVRNCREDEVLRKSFNELTQKVFAFNFEQWYQKGYWGKEYCPYSIAEGERIVANISVNFMTFMVDGVKRRYIQLGTVMTDPEYRGQHLSRYLMERILSDYQMKKTEQKSVKVDGIYLFGNDSVCDFYPIFGFKTGVQYSRYADIDALGKAEGELIHIDLTQPENETMIKEVIAKQRPNSRTEFDNLNLHMFYLIGPDKEKLYYMPSEKAYVVAEMEEEKCRISQIYADHQVDLLQMMRIIAGKTSASEIELGFSPLEEAVAGCPAIKTRVHQEEDCTYFYKGDKIREFEQKKLMYPELSHA